MTRVNALILATFVGSFFLFASLWIGIDIWVFAKAPSESGTSWAMTLLGYESPIISYFVGGITWAVPVGLAVHFWEGVLSPSEWDELVALRAKVAELEAPRA